MYREDTVAKSLGKKFDELYGYDGMNQLVNMQRGELNASKTALTSNTKAFAESFNFDAMGNWSTYKRDDNGNGTWDLNQARTHNAANEIATISNSATQIAHDRNGNMTKMPSPNDAAVALSCVYDAWNRLVAVDSNIRYDYNAMNHRMKKTVGNTVTTSVFTSGWQELESTAGNETTAYVWGLRYIDDLICRDRKVSATETERLYSLADPNWNVVALADRSGIVQERMSYDAFGELNWLDGSGGRLAASQFAWSRTFTGQVFDAESGLLLYRGRYYHCDLGRFTQRDFVGYHESEQNLYRYVGNNSPLLLDPHGNFAQALVIPAGAAAIAVTALQALLLVAVIVIIAVVLGYVIYRIKEYLDNRRTIPRRKTPELFPRNPIGRPIREPRNGPDPGQSNPNPKPETHGPNVYLPPDTRTDEDCDQSCRKQYPNHVTCERYPYPENYDVQKIFGRHAKKVKKRDVYEFTCGAGGGKHWNIRVSGTFVGTWLCCNCCSDESGKATINFKCKNQ